MKGVEGGSFGRSGGGRASISAGPALSRGGGERGGTMTLSRPTTVSTGRIEGGIISQSLAKPGNAAKGSVINAPRFTPTRPVAEGPVRNFSFANTKAFEAPSVPAASSPKVSLEKRGNNLPKVSLEKAPKPTSGKAQEIFSRRTHFGEISKPRITVQGFNTQVSPPEVKGISSVGLTKRAEAKTNTGSQFNELERKTHISLQKSETKVSAKTENKTVSLVKQQEQDRVLIQNVRTQLVSLGLARSPLDAQRIVEKHLREKAPQRETQVIIPKEGQVLPRTVEPSVIDLKKQTTETARIVKLQTEIKQLAQQKTENADAVLQKLGIVTSMKSQEKSANQPVTGSASQTQAKVRSQADQAAAYMMLQKEKENEKERERQFTVDEEAQAARENMTRTAAVKKIFGKLYESFNPHKQITGADIAAELPLTAPGSALSKLSKELGKSYDGSYDEYRETLGKIGVINSVNEFMTQEQQIRAASPAVERVAQSKKMVGMQDVLRVLGVGVDDRFGFHK